MQTDITAAINIAERFGNLVAKTDYSAAHALLTQEAQKLHPSNEIRWKIEGMTACVAGTIRQVELQENDVRVDWPEKQWGDIASVRVRLIGDVFEEPMTVVLAGEAGAIRIRELRWGQPLSAALPLSGASNVGDGPAAAPEETHGVVEEPDGQ
jgi:hypothetical protein